MPVLFVFIPIRYAGRNREQKPVTRSGDEFALTTGKGRDICGVWNGAGSHARNPSAGNGPTRGAGSVIRPATHDASGPPTIVGAGRGALTIRRMLTLPVHGHSLKQESRPESPPDP